MSAPEQGMVLAHHRRVFLVDTHNFGRKRNAAKDLVNIFDDASAPSLVGLRKQFSLEGEETITHPAYDLNVKRLKSSFRQKRRAVQISDKMPDGSAGAVWATLCLYEQMDGNFELGNDIYAGVEVEDRRVTAEWDRVRKREQERGYTTLIEEEHWQRYLDVYRNLLHGKGYFGSEVPPRVLPVALKQLERERHEFYRGDDPDDNAVMRMIGACVTTEAFDEVWRYAETRPSAVEGAHYLWNSGVFAPQDASTQL